jgi:hypothetical protein
MNNKTPSLKLIAATAFCAAALPLSAQVVKETRETTRTDGADVSETTTTTTMGTISDFGDNRIVVRTEASADPLTYRFTKTTTYVDEGGAPVSIETVKSGLPVTVHYVRDGDALVARKVVVRKAGAPGRTETTTTTTTGTISEFGGQKLIVRSKTSSKPLTYRYSKTTTYVDESGAPVSIETVKSGLPVTVHYIREGDALVARKVIVRKSIDDPVEATTTATTYAGTISDFTPERITIRSTPEADPVSYTFAKNITYVDEAGAPISRELVKAGLPVTVHYVNEGDMRVVDKVVIRKTTRTEPRR